MLSIERWNRSSSWGAGRLTDVEDRLAVAKQEGRTGSLGLADAKHYA